MSAAPGSSPAGSPTAGAGIVFASVGELTAAVGRHLGPSRWLMVDQDVIQNFADTTGDRQWIHLDPDRAAAGPFGGTVAHGFLVLSLIPTLVYQVYRVRGIRLAVNYGLDRVRFPAALRAGGQVRAAVELRSVTECPGGVQVVTRVTVEVAGASKPCCVADTVARLYL
ncbi:MAG TPA: MaoC family dehydratase [Jatrophihabitans sp.]|jgi:acyl dehydratase|uniref:MaoC family dehydratase n=1 Tax=Jatrophihabitans sp. TaxID=1932789 RepID=UPI002EDCD8C5